MYTSSPFQRLFGFDLEFAGTKEVVQGRIFAGTYVEDGSTVTVVGEM